MKEYMIRHRRFPYAAGSILLVILIFLISGTPAFISTSKAAKKLPIYCVQRDDKCVSLTFDATWGNEDTHRSAFRIPESRDPACGNIDLGNEFA